jgi:hypothetical protein
LSSTSGRPAGSKKRSRRLSASFRERMACAVTARRISSARRTCRCCRGRLRLSSGAVRP